MPKLTINNTPVDVEPGTTVLQACQQLGIEVPVFCYHPKLSVAGNCRMCLVEMEKSPKPIASCAMPAGEGMVIHTNTPTVEKARKGVLEFLLINHPLDCPICDQGGECDLQDITFNYSRGESRFELNKRAVENKNMGPLIKTVMNRCIHCTRCIRFSQEIAGTPEMGAIHRGEHTEITTYLEGSLTSELSGNLIDVCPVGALVSKPYTAHGRPWELTKTASIDVLDAVGSHIRLDSRNGVVMRVLPVENDDINEVWIHDKTRFSYDGLTRQRLDKPYVRGVDGKLAPATWEEAFQAIRSRIAEVSGQEIGAIAGDLADCESQILLKELMTALGSGNIDCRQDGAYLRADYRCSYVMNTPIARLEEADAFLLIATNPRHEAPLVNARIRKRFLKGGCEIGVIGNTEELTYPYTHVGDHASALKEIFEGAHPFSETLKNAQRPCVILGQSALTRRDSREILSLAQRTAEKYGAVTAEWSGFNVLQTAAGRVGGLDLGFVPQNGGLDVAGMISGKVRVLYLLNADELSAMTIPPETFVIYQGHHGDAGAHRADVILPGLAFTEKAATYVNVEGRPQRTTLAVPGVGQAKEDWRILRALSAYLLPKPLPYNDADDVRKGLERANSIFTKMGGITKAPWGIVPTGTPETLSQMPFKPVVQNFYMTDPISRHSAIMAACAKEQATTRGGCGGYRHDGRTAHNGREG